MIELKEVSFTDLLPFVEDFKKHSKAYEPPPNEAEAVGIFKENELIGYFILAAYDTYLEINQGYLKPEYRHKNLSKECVRLVEYLAKKLEYKQILLCTQSRFGAYVPFMKDMGFKPRKLVFGKEI